MTTNRFRWNALLTLVIAATAGADQLTKHVARVTLAEGPPRTFLAGFLTLLYAENSGAFLSLGSGLSPAVRATVFSLAVAVGLLFALGVLLVGRIPSRPDALALALIIGGGAGNLLDRITRQGVVTDFAYLEIGPLHTGVFNVADMAITTGVLWLVVSWVFLERRKRAASTEAL
ncbi:MAG TPA: signal peptidase II [Thermoanaerobaculia bacterium]|nr:signal peptidase II [Thermoanaerobaculia bacterium]